MYVNILIYAYCHMQVQQYDIIEFEILRISYDDDDMWSLTGKQK